MGKPYVAPDTPLAVFLRARGITGRALAAKVGVTQPAMSRAIRHCLLSLELAVRICDAIDPARAVIDERYLLLAKVAPALYGRWPAMDLARPVEPQAGASELAQAPA